MSHTPLYISIHRNVQYRPGNQLSLVSDPVDDSRVLYVPLPVVKAAPALLAACEAGLKELTETRRLLWHNDIYGPVQFKMKAAIQATEGTS